MTAAPDVPVEIGAKLALITEHWQPKIVGRLNDIHIKVVKVQGEFVWHTHADTDEMFWVQRGTLTIRLRDRDDVTVTEGQFFVVPMGVEHCPAADSECEVVLLEPAGTVNTGDGDHGTRTASPEWV